MTAPEVYPLLVARSGRAEAGRRARELRLASCGCAALPPFRPGSPSPSGPREGGRQVTLAPQPGAGFAASHTRPPTANAVRIRLGRRYYGRSRPSASCREAARETAAAVVGRITSVALSGRPRPEEMTIRANSSRRSRTSSNNIDAGDQRRRSASAPRGRGPFRSMHFRPHVRSSSASQKRECAAPRARS